MGKSSFSSQKAKCIGIDIAKCIGDSPIINTKSTKINEHWKDINFVESL